MPDAVDSIEQLLTNNLDAMTRAERQLANSLLENYPVSGLSSITAVAQSAEVSTPTVVRLTQKLGFDGFVEFQEALRKEVAAKISGPAARRDVWLADAPDSHILNRFTDSVTNNLRQTLAQIDPATFDQVVKLIGDIDRRVLITGGRITRSLADYLFNHLQVIRPNVQQLGLAPGVWPHYLLDTQPGDLVIIFDIRRYENVLLRLAEMARECEAEIILFTDQWGSPISKVATHRFSCRVDVPSAWDSSISLMLIAEALIGAVHELAWEDSKARMERLEGIFDQTRLFRKFV